VPHCRSGRGCEKIHLCSPCWESNPGRPSRTLIPIWTEQTQILWNPYYAQIFHSRELLCHLFRVAMERSKPSHRFQVFRSRGLFPRVYYMLLSYDLKLRGWVYSHINSLQTVCATINIQGHVFVPTLTV